jgi:hypothetical protein
MTTRQVVLLGVVALLLVALVLRLEHRGLPVSTVVADPVRSPGVLNPDVTQSTIGSTICVHGWTRTVRPPVEYTNALKARQMRVYGETGSLSDYQEDHLISLELGGHPTDPRNLWPEPYPRASAVDQIENELNRKVCDGSMSLREAQERESAMKHSDG